MSQYPIININENPDFIHHASWWFHSKWGIPQEAYKESMEASLNSGATVPTWYVCLDGGTIIGGLGVIENDFHDRKDLTPNICALYVEEEYRGRGIAGELLNFACNEMRSRGVDSLYLVTDHTDFYEKYGWEFHCMVQVDGEPELTRMYVHR